MRLFDFLEADRDAEVTAHFGHRQRRDAGPVHTLGDAVVHAAHEHTVALGEREADALRTSYLGRGGVVHGLGGGGFGCGCRRSRPAGASAAARVRWQRALAGASGGGSGGRRGSLLNGISGSTSDFGRPAARLFVADVVVLRVGLDRGGDAVAQDLRPDEDHEIGLVGLCGCAS